MISKKQVKALINKSYSKKAGKEVVKEIDRRVTEFILSIVKRASRKADFSGRNTLKPDDLI